MRTSTLTLFFLIFAVAPCALSAYSMQGVSSLLSGYNVSGPFIAGLKAVNFTYGGTVYVGLYDPSGAPNFLVNTSGQYSLVLNGTVAYNIMRNYTEATAFSQANFTGLASQMRAYQASSAGTLNNCLTETGLLGTGSTCNASNYCASCQYIPNCKQVMDATGGFSGQFATSIMSFAIADSNLNSNFTAFYGAISTINRNNVLLNLAQLNSSLHGVANITENIYKNSIFPPTPDITPNVLAGCSNYATLESAPWYCAALGYCFNLNYNYTKLAAINASMAEISALPLSNAQALAVAHGMVGISLGYAYPELSQTRLAELHSLINSTLPNYASLVNNTSLLLTHISNPVLSADLSAMVSGYSNLQANYFTANLLNAKASLSAEYANLSSAYGALNASYSSVVALSKNNTMKLLALQVPKQGISGDLMSIAFSELALNSALSTGQISNMTNMTAQLSSISSRLSGYSTSPIGFVELARGFDSPFIGWLAGILGMGYGTAVPAGPLLGAILPLIVGAVVLALLFAFRSYLRGRRKLMENRRTASNWSNIYRMVIALTVLWAIATFLLLSYASASAPFGAFIGAYHSSKYLAIAINGTPTAAALSCASRISAQASALGKAAVVVHFSNGQCYSNNSTKTVDGCLGSYASAGIPVVELQQGTKDTLDLYSLYGTVLDASGNDTVMNLCYVSLLTS